jgi:hypothetical protein
MRLLFRLLVLFIVSVLLFTNCSKSEKVGEDISQSITRRKIVADEDVLKYLDPYISQQTNFIQAITESQKEYRKAENDFQKNRIIRDLYEGYQSALMNNRNISFWFGQIA